MNSLKTILVMILFGGFGAALSVALLIMTEIGTSPTKVGDLFGLHLPNLIFGAVFGFLVGVAAVAFWQLAQRLFSPQLPRA